ncbi:MAG: hypothetical protein Q4A54_02015 [Parabacteroides sp.]|nr:hypothetical protein [Parabacteroides sp.]
MAQMMMEHQGRQFIRTQPCYGRNTNGILNFFLAFFCQILIPLQFRYIHYFLIFCRIHGFDFRTAQIYIEKQKANTIAIEHIIGIAISNIWFAISRIFTDFIIGTDMGSVLLLSFQFNFIQSTEAVDFFLQHTDTVFLLTVYTLLVIETIAIMSQ